VYDARALRGWLMACEHAGTAPRVIEGQGITTLTPVRVRKRATAPCAGGGPRPRWAGLTTFRRLRTLSLLPPETPPRTIPTLTRDVGVQTCTDERPPRKRRRGGVPGAPAIPSEHSAFVRVPTTRSDAGTH
jgi:hypothetical protein